MTEEMSVDCMRLTLLMDHPKSAFPVAHVKGISSILGAAWLSSSGVFSRLSSGLAGFHLQSFHVLNSKCAKVMNDLKVVCMYVG